MVEPKDAEAHPPKQSGNRPARPSEPAAVLLAMQLLKWLMPITGRFPKNYRYGLGSRIEAAHLDVLEELVHAQYSRGEARSRALERANTRLQSARLLMRLAVELKVLSEGAALHAAKQQVELGQQVGAWRKTSVSMENSLRGSVTPVT